MEWTWLVVERGRCGAGCLVIGGSSYFANRARLRCRKEGLILELVSLRLGTMSRQGTAQKEA